MFTGLIEELGTIREVRPLGMGRVIRVSAHKIMEDIKVDDSVAVNGVCQTVVAHTKDTFDVEAVEETIRKTTFNDLRPGMAVNLERASKLGDRMGGHLVQGHVDCTGNILSVEKETAGTLVWITFPEEYSNIVVPLGSITVQGVSLTVAKTEGNKFMISVIPHTWNVTTLKNLRPGSRVNLEFDLIGKYVQKMMKAHTGDKQSTLDKYIDQPDW